MDGLHIAVDPTAPSCNHAPLCYFSKRSKVERGGKIDQGTADDGGSESCGMALITKWIRINTMARMVCDPLNTSQAGEKTASTECEGENPGISEDSRHPSQRRGTKAQDRHEIDPIRRPILDRRSNNDAGQVYGK